MMYESFAYLYDRLTDDIDYNQFFEFIVCQNAVSIKFQNKFVICQTASTLFGINCFGVNIGKHTKLSG